MVKRCSTCGKELPIEEFYLQQDHKDGVMSMCKACFNAYCVERWRLRKRKYVQYLGGRCECCGISLTDSNYAIFDFHHRNPTEKEMVWTKMRLLSEEKVLQELNKCQLLCANCHRLVHQNDEKLK